MFRQQARRSGTRLACCGPRVPIQARRPARFGRMSTFGLRTARTGPGPGSATLRRIMKPSSGCRAACQAARAHSPKDRSVMFRLRDTIVSPHCFCFGCERPLKTRAWVWVWVWVSEPLRHRRPAVKSVLLGQDGLATANRRPVRPRVPAHPRRPIRHTRHCLCDQGEPIESQKRSRVA